MFKLINMRNVNRNWGNSYIKSMSSSKPLSERLVIHRACRKKDNSHRVIYQINSYGEIVKQWKSISEICEVLKTYDSKVRYAISNKKIVGGCLFVYRIDYKTTTNYKLLIKILTNKLVKIEG